MDFVKDQEELYNKTNEHFKQKARKECFRERFTNSHNVCQSVQDLVRISKYSLQQTCAVQVSHAPKEMTQRQNWIQEKFNSLKAQMYKMQ